MKTTTLFSFMIIYIIINGTVLGTVRDFKTKEVSIGAQVIINKTDTVYTNSNGEFYANVDSIKTLTTSYPPDQSKIIANK
jgi:hypothetical protein